MDVFVSSPFGKEFDEIFQAISQAASKRGLEAYRVDQDHLAEPIADAIQRRIRESRIVIADLTGNNPNVLNEIGQAQTLGKPLILISQHSPEDAPFNVRSLRILRYSHQNLSALSDSVEHALSLASSPNEILRSMLIPSSLGHPQKESKFVIAVSPLSFRRAMGRHAGYKRLRRTSSDYVGLRGILQAFGLLYGFNTLPDIIDPEDCRDEVLDESMNIYCIGSPKTNRWTGMLLNQYQKLFVPRLEFRADPLSKNLRNVKLSLYSDDVLLQPIGWKQNADGDRYYRDFGLIVRGPNPNNEKQMASIVAGRSSLGTEACCRALTDSNTINEILNRLRGFNIELENHKQAFWAIVSMDREIGNEKEEAIIDSLRVRQVQPFHLQD